MRADYQNGTKSEVMKVRGGRKSARIPRVPGAGVFSGEQQALGSSPKRLTTGRRSAVASVVLPRSTDLEAPRLGKSISFLLFSSRLFRNGNSPDLFMSQDHMGEFVGNYSQALIVREREGLGRYVQLSARQGPPLP